MITKERMVNAVRDLPDNASIEDAMEKLLLLSKIDRGLDQVENGETIPHSEVVNRMAKWLK
jgi:predicted transcriptional regulator